jgi:large subunit ribosomal protein L30
LDKEETQMADKTIKITLTKSVIGASPLQRKIVEALGLRKMQHTVIRPDTPQTRGAVEKVKHLVTVEEVQ